MAGIPLKNPRWEKFCRAYVEGPAAGNATASYVAAGFAGEGTQTARSGAFRLLHKECIRIRVEELQMAAVRRDEQALAKAADRLSLREEAILRQLACMGFANILDYLRRDETGELVVDLAAIERDQAAGIVELVVNETDDGEKRKKTTRVRLGNRHAALVALGKHFGMFIGKKEERDEILQLSEEELKRELAEHQRQRGVKEVPLEEAPSSVNQTPPEESESS